MVCKRDLVFHWLTSISLHRHTLYISLTRFHSVQSLFVACWSIASVSQHWVHMRTIFVFSLIWLSQLTFRWASKQCIILLCSLSFVWHFFRLYGWNQQVTENLTWIRIKESPQKNLFEILPSVNRNDVLYVSHPVFTTRRMRPPRRKKVSGWWER